jgi:hypothetical protein
MIALTVGAVAVLALAGSYAMALDEGTVLVGAFADRGPQYGKALVIKVINSPYVGPPGQLPPDDPPPKQIAHGTSLDGKAPGSGTTAGGINLRGGIGMIASASPQARVEKSLKDLARDLR